MAKFNKGDKIKCVDTSDCDYALTVGKVYEVQEMTSSGNCVYVTTDSGDYGAPFAYRFELVIAPANGVDEGGSPKNFTLADLEPLQRIVTKDGRNAIVGVTPSHGKVIVYTSVGYDSFDYAQLDGEKHKSHPEINIVEVYANPGYASMYNPEKKGKLIWKAVDAAKVRAITDADAAVAKAREELAKAEAARAAL